MGSGFWFHCKGVAPAGSLPSERITEPMAVYHNMLAIDIVALAIKYLHMKKPKEAADPIMYWLNILIGPLVPLPKLQVKTGRE